MYFGDFAPNVRPVAARRARLQLAHGDLASAASWAASDGLAADDELSYLREFEHITLAMVLLAQHRAGHAPAAAARWPDDSSSGCWPQRRPAAGWAPSSRSWCSWRWRPQPRATGRVPRTSWTRPGPGRARGPHPGLPRRRTSPDCAAARRRPDATGRASRRGRCSPPPHRNAEARRTGPWQPSDTGTASRRPAQRARARRPAAPRQRPGRP